MHLTLLPGECHRTLLMMSQHWFRWWLGVIKQKVIWVNVDQNLCHHMASLSRNKLMYWGWMMHIYISKLTIIGSDNGLSPVWHQAIIRTDAGILVIGHLGTHFSEIFIEIYRFSFKKMYLKTLSRKWWPLCLSLNVLTLLALSSPMGSHLSFLINCHLFSKR